MCVGDNQCLVHLQKNPARVDLLPLLELSYVVHQLACLHSSVAALVTLALPPATFSVDACSFGSFCISGACVRRGCTLLVVDLLNTNPRAGGGGGGGGRNGAGADAFGAAPLVLRSVLDSSSTAVGPGSNSSTNTSSTGGPSGLPGSPPATRSQEQQGGRELSLSSAPVQVGGVGGVAGVGGMVGVGGYMCGAQAGGGSPCVLNLYF
jgi:hypothetical protein